MIEEGGPYRDRQEQKIYLELPTNIKKGQDCPDFIQAIESVNFDPKKITIKSSNLGSLEWMRTSPSGDIFYFHFENPSNGKVTIVDLNTFKSSDNFYITIAYNKRERTAIVHDVHTKEEGEIIRTRLYQHEENRDKLEILLKKVTPEIETKKIQLVLGLTDRVLEGASLSLADTIDGISYSRGKENIKKFEKIGPEKTVFYSAQTGILRYVNTEPQLNGKHAIYNYVSEDSWAIKLSIILDKTKKDEERLTVISITK